MTLNRSSVIFALAAVLAIIPHLAKAADYNPAYLISDAEITDYQSMSASDIQAFLDKRNGTLNNYLTFDKEGLPKTAVQSFFEIAQRWQINPKYLMVLTQKEQSLLEDNTPTQKQYDWATGYGICDSCSMDDPNLDKYRGFYRQVNSAAAQTRYYMDNINEFTYQPGKTYNIDGTTVKIINTATAGLFNYTPHLHGNLNFWNLWSKYFGKKWPDGTLLTASDSSSTDVYLIEDGLKRLISSKAVLMSLYDPKYIIAAPMSDINTYDDGVPIKYINFSILRSESSGNLYMVVNDTKRMIETADIFKKLGFNQDDITTTTESDLSLYKDGSTIGDFTVYPTGALLQDAAAKKPYQGLYYVLSGEKRLVANKEVLDANFSGMKIKKVSAAELDGYMTGSGMGLPDGWLVKSKTAPKYKTVYVTVKKKKVATKVQTNPEVSTIYVISGGQKLPILNGDVFAKMGYKSKNVKLVSDETLNLMPIGATLAGI